MILDLTPKPRFTRYEESAYSHLESKFRHIGKKIWGQIQKFPKAGLDFFEEEFDHSSNTVFYTFTKKDYTWFDFNEILIAYKMAIVKHARDGVNVVASLYNLRLKNIYNEVTFNKVVICSNHRKEYATLQFFVEDTDSEPYLEFKMPQNAYDPENEDIEDIENRIPFYGTSYCVITIRFWVSTAIPYIKPDVKKSIILKKGAKDVLGDSKKNLPMANFYCLDARTREKDMNWPKITFTGKHKNTLYYEILPQKGKTYILGTVEHFERKMKELAEDTGCKVVVRMYIPRRYLLKEMGILLWVKAFKGFSFFSPRKIYSRNHSLLILKA